MTKGNDKSIGDRKVSLSAQDYATPGTAFTGVVASTTGNFYVECSGSEIDGWIPKNIGQGKYEIYVPGNEITCPGPLIIRDTNSTGTILLQVPVKPCP